MFFLVGCCGVVNSGLALTQRLTFGKRINKTEITCPPLFVIGHWRTGTTLLHELISLDQQFAYPSTFECFTPHHFLVSRTLLKWPLAWTLPNKRPMDSMKNGIDLPQEDEFALCTLGCPTPYRKMAFPNEGVVYPELIDMKNVDANTLDDFRAALTYFLKALTLRYDKRLALKSPTHTGRIGTLNEWFPGSKFLHIARNPYDTIPSTVHLWRTLEKFQGLQLPKYSDEDLLTEILDTFESMYDSYFEHRDQLAPDQICEIRFEELIQDPVNVLATAYETLELEGFEQVKPKIEANFEARKGHKINPKNLDANLKASIDRRLDRYISEFGYNTASAAV